MVDVDVDELRRLILAPFPPKEGWVVVPCGDEKIPLWCADQPSALDLWEGLKEARPDARMGLVKNGLYFDATPGAKNYICPYCGKASAHPEDLANRYCGKCHTFEDGLTPLRRFVDEARECEA
ncbi:hypothetical protein [Longispora urticae]